MTSDSTIAYDFIRNQVLYKQALRVIVNKGITFVYHVYFLKVFGVDAELRDITAKDKNGAV